MVALRSERRVYLWYMTPHCMPSEAGKSVNLGQIFAILQKAFNSGKAFTYLDSDGNIVPESTTADVKKCIFIADLKTNSDGSVCTLLINRGDPDVAHPSFINPIARSVEHVSPRSDQVQGWSAHMTIRMTADAKGRHRACFERMTGVSSTLVQRYLDALIDAATDGDSNYLYKKPLKRGKKVIVEERPYKLRLGINKTPSESLTRDLQNGFLSSITLVRSDALYSGPGTPDVLRSVSEKLTIRTKKVSRNSAVDYIKDVTAWGKNNNYDEVQLKIENLPGDTSAQPRFSLDKADAMDTLYTRSRPLTGFTGLLETCYEEISPEIQGKMINELRNETLW
ncbi:MULTISPECIES: hypothetical protein [unclassified Sphingomonas]|uniref:hypothetical protein n=1 Tax=Sphingomonas sp. PvP015 TaxID=3156388 RepID=UPI003394ED4E